MSRESKMQRSRGFNPSHIQAAHLRAAHIRAADIPTAMPPLRATLWLWFACGLMALLAFPGLRGFNATIGWLPFWLVVAPLIDLAVLRRHWLAATSRAFLARARRRRRPARQARRLQHRRVMRTAPRPRLANP
jgi:hypothetical protein